MTIAALTSAAELLSNAQCVVSSETANTEVKVKDWLKATWLRKVSGLGEALALEYNVQIADLIIESASSTTPDEPSFTAAVDGNEQTPEETDGKFYFSVKAAVNGARETLALKSCVIEAKAYIKPVISIVEAKLPDASVGKCYWYNGLYNLLTSSFEGPNVNWKIVNFNISGLNISDFTFGIISGGPTTPGIYRLKVKAYASDGRYQEQTFELQLEVKAAQQGQPETSTTSVTGTVTTENGTPLLNYEVAATDNEGNVIARAVTGENGNYVFETLHPNEAYNLRVQGIKGNNTTTVKTLDQGAQLSKNIMLPIANIPGAAWKSLPISNGNPVVEFVPTPNNSGENTILAEIYSAENQDYIYAANQFSSSTIVSEKIGLTVPENKIVMQYVGGFQGTNYRQGDMVEIEGQEYLVELTTIAGTTIYLVNLSNGKTYSCGGNDKLPGTVFSNGFIAKKIKWSI